MRGGDRLGLARQHESEPFWVVPGRLDPHLVAVKRAGARAIGPGLHGAMQICQRAIALIRRPGQPLRRDAPNPLAATEVNAVAGWLWGGAARVKRLLHGEISATGPRESHSLQPLVRRPTSSHSLPLPLSWPGISNVRAALTPGGGKSLLPVIAGSPLALADVWGGAASVLNLPDGARTTTIGSKTHFADPAWPRPLLQARRYEEAGHHEPISDISGQFSEAQPDQGLRLSLLARLLERSDKGGRGRRLSTAKGDQGRDRIRRRLWRATVPHGLRQAHERRIDVREGWGLVLQLRDDASRELATDTRSSRD